MYRTSTGTVPVLGRSYLYWYEYRKSVQYVLYARVRTVPIRRTSYVRL